MPLSAALLACAALLVHPLTMERVVAVESGGDPIAINVNGVGRAHPADLADAAAIAQRWIARGRTVDIGLTQVNSANLPELGLTVEQVLDPCTNLHAGAVILSGFYGRAVQRFGEGQPALKAALSGYNTGDLQRGFANGYVGKYVLSASLTQVRTVATVAPRVFPTTIAYDRPGLDLRLNK